MIDRRSIVLGAAAAAVASGAAAGAAEAPAVKIVQDPPFFVSGPMARNMMASFFRTPPSPLILPDTPLISADGPRRLSQLRGRTWLVSLWSEDCAPCLVEATDLAAIARTHGGPSFGVLFVLTESHKKLDLAGARAVLAKRGAGDAQLFVEPNGGMAVENALAKWDGQASLPCNLLVDRGGRVRARSFGAPVVSVSSVHHDGEVHVLTEADKARSLASDHTMWATPAGSEFAAALAAGVLEKA